MIEGDPHQTEGDPYQGIAFAMPMSAQFGRQRLKALSG